MSQAELKTINKNHYDFVIFGSDIAAHYLAFQLERKFNKSVAMLEATDSISDIDGPVVAKNFKLASHFHSFASGSEMNQFLNEVTDLIGEDTIDLNHELDPISFEGGEVIPFVGFGERKFKSMDLLGDFTFTQRTSLKLSPSEIIQRLNNEFLGDYYNLAEVTEFTYSEDEQKITAAIINGAKSVSGDYYIYCQSPKSLESVVSSDLLQSKALQKINKAKSFARVRLHLKHPNSLTNSENFHFLYGNKDDFEPCVGQAWSENEQHYSNWFTLTPADLAEDPEHLGACLRFIKKQIKRVYPQAMNEILGEKIVVETDSFAHIPWDPKLITGQIAKVDNLWLCHQQLSNHSGFVGSCSQAQYLLNELRQLLNLQETTKYSLSTAQAPTNPL